MAKVRLDTLLVRRGLVASRERARALILAGSVQVNGLVVAKAGAQVTGDAAVSLRQEDHPYVSRGALKLLHALDSFALDPSGQAIVDVGASTGGFTDILLRRGARRVYAIDVGYGQLAWSLRSDARVVVLERENIRYLDPEKIVEPCDGAVIDVSFISLKLVLPKVASLLSPPRAHQANARTGWIVALIKPQFEAGREQVGKGGVVRDLAIREAVVKELQGWAQEHGFVVGACVESPITGPAGNVEFLQLLHLPTEKTE